jgi:hypothetical protein
MLKSINVHRVGLFINTILTHLMGFMLHLGFEKSTVSGIEILPKLNGKH